MTNPIPQLSNVPNPLPKTQADWQAFQIVLNEWKTTLGPPKWQAPTLLNGWVRYSGSAVTTPPGYYIDLTGRIWLRGLLNGNTSIPSVIFQLPVISPYDQIMQTIALSTAGYTSARIDLTPVGAVECTDVFSGSFSNTSSTFLCLDGLSFSLQS